MGSNGILMYSNPQQNDEQCFQDASLVFFPSQFRGV